MTLATTPPAAVWDRLRQQSAALGIELAPDQIDCLKKLSTLLLTWNRKINLTRIDREDEVIEKHFLDSLAAAAAVPKVASSVIDVGSGAGFPGILIALVRPNVSVMTLEPIHKKVAFTRQAARELGLSNLEAKAERLEQIAARHSGFDVAVSRATFEPSEWLRKSLGITKPGGLVLAMTIAAAADLDVPELLSFERTLSYQIDGVAREVRCFRRRSA